VTFTTDSEFLYAVSLLKEPRLFRVHTNVPPTPATTTSSTSSMTPQVPGPTTPYSHEQQEWRGHGHRRWRDEDGDGTDLAHRHYHHGPGHAGHGPGHGYGPGHAGHGPGHGHGHAGYGYGHGYGHGRHHKQPKVKELDARFVEHVTYDDGCHVSAGSSFMKIWKIRNNGALRWPEGTLLARVDRANELSAPDITSLPPTHLPAVGEEVHVGVSLRAPQSAGEYTSYFKLLAPAGKKFGQRLRCQVLSVQDDKSDVWKSLEQMGFVEVNQRPSHVAGIIAKERNINDVVRAILVHPQHQQQQQQQQQ